MSREIMLLQAKPKLVLSKELQTQILYFHSLVGDVEWSGPLFYTIESGSVDDLANLVIKAELMLPKDVGTASYTEYEMGIEMIDFYELYPQTIGMKLGHIHTHHNMKTFFSGTDTAELHDNAPNHAYYVSLIVNHAGKYSAKIAIVSTVDTEFEYKGSNGKMAKISTGKKEVLLTADFVIDFEADEFMMETIKELIDAASKKRVVMASSAKQLTSVVKPGLPSKATSRGTGGYKKIETKSKTYKERAAQAEAILPKLLLLDSTVKLDLNTTLATLDMHYADDVESMEDYVKNVVSKLDTFYVNHCASHDINSNIFSFMIDCSAALEEYHEIYYIASCFTEAMDAKYDSLIMEEDGY